jgi:ATP-dependent Clp protease ATP-binding subunit ClpA
MSNLDWQGDQFRVGRTGPGGGRNKGRTGAVLLLLMTVVLRPPARADEGSYEGSLANPFAGAPQDTWLSLSAATGERIAFFPLRAIRQLKRRADDGAWELTADHADRTWQTAGPALALYALNPFSQQLLARRVGPNESTLDVSRSLQTTSWDHPDRLSGWTAIDTRDFPHNDALLISQPATIAPETKQPDGGKLAQALEVLKLYGEDLTAKAAQNQLDPVVGRDEELKELTIALTQLDRPNVLVVAPPGTGKSSLLHALAMRMAAGQVKRLAGRKLVTVPVANLVAGAELRGDVAKRVKALTDALLQVPRAQRPIVVFPGIHSIIGAGKSKDSNSEHLAGMLAPLLDKELVTIGTTTAGGALQLQEAEPELHQKFQPLTLKPYTPRELEKILEGKRSQYEQHHQVTIKPGAIRAAAKIAPEYLINLSNIVGALQVLDRAAASAAYEGKETVDKTDILRALSARLGFSITATGGAERKLLGQLPERLGRRIIGQPDAIHAVTASYRTHRLRLTTEAKRPASFLFFGRTGVGKTELALAFARERLPGGVERPDSALLTRFNMSEYQGLGGLSRLLGSSDKPGLLSETLLENPFAVVLFDEFEKATPDVQKLLLQILDEGKIQDGAGRVLDFRHSVVIMTSNAAAHLLDKNAVGFVQPGDADRGKPELAIPEKVREELNRVFSPELINRTTLVPFRTLEHAHVRQITDLMLEPMITRFKQATRGAELVVSTEARDQLARLGYSPKNGARPLRGVLARHVEDPLSARELRRKFKRGETVELRYEKVGKHRPRFRMLRAPTRVGPHAPATRAAAR